MTGKIEISEPEKSLRELVAQLGGNAVVDWRIRADGVSSMFVTPTEEGQCPFNVGWSSHEIVIGFSGGRRIEVGPGEADLGLMRQLISGVIHGRVWEVHRGGLVQICIGLEDGSRICDPPSLDWLHGGIVRRLSSFDPTFSTAVKRQARSSARREKHVHLTGWTCPCACRNQVHAVVSVARTRGGFLGGSRVVGCRDGQSCLDRRSWG